MSLLITSYICLIISMILFTLFKNELSKKKKRYISFLVGKFFTYCKFILLRVCFFTKNKELKK